MYFIPRIGNPEIYDAVEPNLRLLTIEEYHRLPNGVILESINGRRITKGIDCIVFDTRANYLAWGLNMNDYHEPPNRLLEFILKS